MISDCPYYTFRENFWKAFFINDLSKTTPQIYYRQKKHAKKKKERMKESPLKGLRLDDLKVLLAPFMKEKKPTIARKRPRKTHAQTDPCTDRELIIIEQRPFHTREIREILKELKKQCFEVCQRVIPEDYILGEMNHSYGLPAASRVFVYVHSPIEEKRKTRSKSSAEVRSIFICAFALLQERNFETKENKLNKYVYLDLLCARANTGLGGILLEDVISYYRSKQFLFLEIRALPGLIQYYLRKGFKFGSPRFSDFFLLLEGEDFEDGVHMYLSLNV
jgi:hypothetical protein